MRRKEMRILSAVLAIALMLFLTPLSALKAAAAGDDAPYVSWDKAEIALAGQAIPFRLASYNSSFTASQIWMAVTAGQDGQAIRMDFKDVVKSMRAYVYSASELQKNGPKDSGSSYLRCYTFGFDSCFSYKASSAGVYYILLIPNGSGNVASASSSVTFNLTDGDANEPNDSWSSATELTQNVNTYYNLNGDNDTDWFRITTTVPGEAFKLIFSNFDYTVSAIEAYIYSGADLVAGNTSELAKKTNFSTDGSYSYKANVPGDYYVKIKTYSSTAFITRSLKLRYEIVPGDANELNDTWDKATLLKDSTDLSFTLNGANDADWFKFETTTESEPVTINFSGFDTDYSNKITYFVYDAASGGVSDSLIYEYINITHSKPMTFSKVGMHYIKVLVNGSEPVENPLKLRIERGQVSPGEPNDTWQTANSLTEGTDMNFSLPSATDVDWFKLSADKPNMTLKVTFSNVPSGGSVFFKLYSGSALQSAGSGTYDLRYDYASSGTKTCYYMLPDTGDYYIRCAANGSSSIFSTDAQIKYELIEPDQNERNNTWKTATAVTEGVNAAFTLPADNDADWFKFTTAEPNQAVKISFSDIPAGDSIYYALYAGSDFQSVGDNASNIQYDYTNSGAETYYCMLPDTGDYYIRCSANGSSSIFSTDAQIKYELIEPDQNERNNTWKTATAVTEGVDTAFTLPADNDADWFKFTTTEPNQTVKISLSDIPAGDSIYYALYAGSDFQTVGDNASNLQYDYTNSSAETYYYMLPDAGDYYIRCSANGSNSVFFSEAKLHYDLIAPDAHENNNSKEKSTALSPNSPVWLTLTAGNDDDWFKLCDLAVGDKVTATFGDVQNGSSSVYANLHLLKAGETTAASVAYATVDRSKGVSSATWTIAAAGQYYIRMNANDHVSSSMYLRYSVSRGAEAVTGVSLTQSLTLFSGYTTLLSAVISPYYAANQAVTWSSSNASVADVDANGKVTAAGAGTAVITVRTADGGKTASCSVTVVPAVAVTSVEIDQSYAQTSPKNLALGTNVLLNPVFTPENATNKDVVWSVSDPKVLSVTSYGRVAAIGSGTAKVIVTTADGAKIAESWFSVPDETYPVRSVQLSAANATIYLGEASLQLTATVKPTYATNSAVVWSSSNPAAAAVSKDGLVTQLAVGYATIYAKAEENNAVFGSCEIAVQPARTRVSSVRFANTALSLGLYGELTLSPTVAPDNATDKSVSWSSSNTTVASVSRTGVVTAVGTGTAVITATSTDGGLSATCTITVTAGSALGDVSNDGSIDVADALLILQYNVGLRALTQNQLAVADVNADGFTDAGDAILVLRFTAGFIDKFPAEK
jgi:uncharacterized protein YjdB